ncbi:MAG: hypothetical protein OJF62_000620 [Pseudolabrys sp.]|jgi:sporulation protein YlmC with PRC-barrel domain|nr:hypothetical protein [Pseudolabrys sp.]
MMKQLLIGVALGALTLSAAQAQSTPPTGGSKAPAAQTQTMPNNSSSPSTKSGSSSTSSSSSSSSGMQQNASADHVITSQQPDQWLASKFKGTTVLGPDNKSIGDVSDILFDKDGKIEAYVVSVGGFLGMGAKDVALAPASFEVVPGTNNASPKLKLSMSKDQLKEAQNFEPYKAPQATTTGSGAPSAGGMGAHPSPLSSPKGK